MSQKEQAMHVTKPDSLKDIRVAENCAGSTRIIEVERDQAAYAALIPETHSSGVLCLLSEDKELSSTVRVVACESLSEQMSAEHKTSHGWNRALLVNKRFSALSRDEVSALTYQLKRLVAENNDEGHFSIPGGIGPEPHRIGEIQSTVDTLARETAILTRELGFNLFALSPSPNGLSSDIYLCESMEAYARGKLAKNGFMVLKGAKGRLGAEESLAVQLQRELQSSGVLRVESSTVYFERDHVFTNHALAATAVLGRSSTGFFEWKHPDGLTLGETLRESLARL